MQIYRKDLEEKIGFLKDKDQHLRMSAPPEPRPGKSHDGDDEDNGDHGDDHVHLRAGLAGEVAVGRVENGPEDKELG